MRHLWKWLFEPANCTERPCWRELVENAVSGIYPTDQQLENMLEHLERTP